MTMSHEMDISQQQSMYGAFKRIIKYSLLGVVVVLILLALFLL